MLIQIMPDGEYLSLSKEAPVVGHTYSLEIVTGKTRKPRTTGAKSQNHHLNGHVGQLACAAGISTGTMKNYIKTRAALELNYPTEEFDGKVWAISEADSSTVECGLLIDMCHMVAAEKGYALFEAEGWYNP